jgi:hypothetical protein
MRDLGLDSASKVRAFLLKRSAAQVGYLLLDIGVNGAAALACFVTFSALLPLPDEQLAPAARFALSGLAAVGGGGFMTTARARRSASQACSLR